jgi:hypothetical protein
VTFNAADAVHNAFVWFETNSGWAPPDAETLAEWIGDGVCRCPDECLVAPRGWCEHGLASWWLILRADDEGGDVATGVREHRRAVEAGDPGYTDPASGLFVMTSQYLSDRGYCCEQGCRHCPYPSAAPSS